eukprot:TRINITY_DN5492_c0_g1_i3.p1 TRINITY_DN5492_c0_g1~~TRINITY_DN5492_c0_g1_i3.p1  ORF type:complete len:142 (+),score=56.82 TRINITY_DN5492_c0_g1_i3:76-501(+)
MASTPKPLVSMAEVAKHNRKGDAWIVYNGKAYDVTNFMENHPGGEDAIMGLVGTDVTVEFDEIGHSDMAVSQMADFLIAEMDPLAKVVDAPSSAKAAPTPAKRYTVEPKNVRNEESSLLVPLLAVAAGVAATVAYFYLKRR